MAIDVLRFGTDGVRGKAGQGILQVRQVERLGRTLADFLQRDGSVDGPVLIGGDTRASRDEITEALGRGLSSRGVASLDLGVLPTTGLAILAQDYGAVASLVVSASHNPAEDNGIKVFPGSGAKLSDAESRWIEERWAEVGNEPGTVDADLLERRSDGAERFVVRWLEAVPQLRLDGWRVALDAAHGAAYWVGPELFRRLGAEVLTLGVNPDGSNINEGCGSLYLDGLSALVREQGARFGIALDGDADRCLFVDEHGKVVDGDGALSMMAVDLMESSRLPERTVVGTVMSNYGLELFLKAQGATLVRTPVGDRHVSLRLRQDGLGLGGEPSGHMIFGADLSYLGDGLYTALRIAELLVRRGSPFSEAVSELKLLPQVLKAVRVSSRPPLEEISGFREKLSAAEKRLAGRGRVVVRYSGTEPVLRVMVEGENAAEVEVLAQTLAEHAEQEIGRA